MWRWTIPPWEGDLGLSAPQLKLWGLVGKLPLWMWLDSRRMPTRPGLPVGNQVFHWCTMEEAGLWLWDGSLSKWVRDHWSHQGSEGPLCLHPLGCGHPPDSTNQQHWGLAHHLYQRDWGRLCSHLSRGRELLLIGHLWCRILRHFQHLFNSIIPCQGHPASRGRGHWGGGQGLPCLPYCLQCCPQGQPSWGMWHNGYPIPPTTRECSYICCSDHSPRGIPSWTGTCPADSSFLCPSSNQTFTSVQVATQLTWLGEGSLPTCGYLQFGSQGATPLKVEGGNTPDKESAGSLQQGFPASAKGEGGILPRKLPTL